MLSRCALILVLRVVGAWPHSSQDVRAKAAAKDVAIEDSGVVAGAFGMCGQE